jgi:RNA polymerase sigma factor (sigma-70 family)
LYKEFYSYAVAICLRYSKSYDEALEILNDGFLKVFTKLEQHSDDLSFKGWLRKLMINSAIDWFRKNEKHSHSLDISYVRSKSMDESIVEDLSAQEIINTIQQLPSSYRIVFNLHVIEGYSHEEIATQLGISAGTSKSNLAVAREKLRKLLTRDNKERLTGKGNG